MNHDVPGDESAAAPTAEKAEAQESEHTEAAPDAEVDESAEVDEEPLSELECAQREAAENRDNYFRVAAELENLRKRGARELENARKYGLERLAQALLPVRDSLQAGVAAADDSDAADNTDVESLREGKRATLRLLDAAEARQSAGLDGTQALLIVGFESGDHPQDGNMQAAVAMARELEGQIDDDQIRVDDGSGKATGREGAVGAWRSASGSIVSNTPAAATVNITMPRNITTSLPRCGTKRARITGAALTTCPATG